MKKKRDIEVTARDKFGELKDGVYTGESLGMHHVSFYDGHTNSFNNPHNILFKDPKQQPPMFSIDTLISKIRKDYISLQGSAVNDQYYEELERIRIRVKNIVARSKDFSQFNRKSILTIISLNNKLGIFSSHRFGIHIDLKKL